MRLADTAVKEIVALVRAANEPGVGLRITLQPGGCSGQFIYVSLDKQGEGDAVLTQDGATVYVDPRLASVIEGATLDYGAGLKPPRFRIRNARVTHKCACGRSIGSPYLGKSKQCRAYEPIPWLQGG